MLACIGECMLEFSNQDGETYRLGYGGDVFNTAVYAVRTGVPCAFLSATGDDRMSRYLLASWEGESVDCSDVRIVPGTSPALYVIDNDESGEKQFSYWRDASPYRRMFEPGEYRDTFAQRLRRFDVLYFSGISLAVLEEEDRQWLLDALKTRRGDCRIAFDPNYRARLWPQGDAGEWFAKAYELADIALPSLEDASEIEAGITAERLAAEIRSEEVVVKMGTDGVYARVLEEQLKVAVPDVQAAVDTTGAGDAFNGGYLAARLLGRSPEEAIDIGQSLSARVVCHRGAIVPREVTDD